MEDESKPKAPEWAKRDLAINERVKEVCNLGITATKAEIDALKKKLRKLVR